MLRPWPKDRVKKLWPLGVWSSKWIFCKKKRGWSGVLARGKSNKTCEASESIEFTTITITAAQFEVCLQLMPLQGIHYTYVLWGSDAQWKPWWNCQAEPFVLAPLFCLLNTSLIYIMWTVDTSFILQLLICVYPRQRINYYYPSVWLVDSPVLFGSRKKTDFPAGSVSTFWLKCLGGCGGVFFCPIYIWICFAHQSEIIVL